MMWLRLNMLRNMLTRSANDVIMIGRARAEELNGVWSDIAGPQEEQTGHITLKEGAEVNLPVPNTPSLPTTTTVRVHSADQPPATP